MKKIYNGLFCSLHFFAGRLKKTNLNISYTVKKINIVILNIRALEVVLVERITHISWKKVTLLQSLIFNVMLDFTFLLALTESFMQFLHDIIKSGLCY